MTTICYLWTYTKCQSKQEMVVTYFLMCSCSFRYRSDRLFSPEEFLQALRTLRLTMLLLKLTLIKQSFTEDLQQYCEQTSVIRDIDTKITFHTRSSAINALKSDLMSLQHCLSFIYCLPTHLSLPSVNLPFTSPSIILQPATVFICSKYFNCLTLISFNKASFPYNIYRYQ